MASMSKSTQIQNIRNLLDNSLRIRLTPGNADDVKAAAWAFQYAITSITDDSIQFLMDNKNARLRIQKLKPKPEEQSNGRRNKR